MQSFFARKAPSEESILEALQLPHEILDVPGFKVEVEKAGSVVHLHVPWRAGEASYEHAVGLAYAFDLSLHNLVKVEMDPNGVTGLHFHFPARTLLKDAEIQESVRRVLDKTGCVEAAMLSQDRDAPEWRMFEAKREPAWRTAIEGGLEGLTELSRRVSAFLEELRKNTEEPDCDELSVVVVPLSKNRVRVEFEMSPEDARAALKSMKRELEKIGAQALIVDQSREEFATFAVIATEEQLDRVKEIIREETTAD